MESMNNPERLSRYSGRLLTAQTKPNSNEQKKSANKRTKSYFFPFKYYYFLVRKYWIRFKPCKNKNRADNKTDMMTEFNNKKVHKK